MKSDVMVIGGGIVGLSTAWQLQQRMPDRRILLIEKGAQLAMHQTGHNSGVIHSGIYYQPGSLKADFCKQGLVETMAFCKKSGIHYEQCGKLVVAADESEMQRMYALYDRCKQNGIDCELYDQSQLRECEPNIKGSGAIYTGLTGIVDFRKVADAMANEFRNLGGRIELNHEVLSIRENDIGITVQTGNTTFRSDYLVCCAGLQADRLVRMHGLDAEFHIIPFRGEYYRLTPRLSGIVSHLVYPVPDPALPFLGIHLTRMIDGSITVGPNAVLGWKREGYGNLNFNLRDTVDFLGFNGFWKLLRSNYRHGLLELKNSVFKSVYLQQVQKYCPQIEKDDLLPYPAGVRAQAVMSDGTLVHDFLFAESRRSLHVCNAPSPAATSAFPIGEYITSKVTEKSGC